MYGGYIIPQLPILRSEEDYLREEPQEPMIDDVPDAFKAWCKRNAGNIELAKQGKRSMPYFVRDNIELVNRLLQQPAVTVAPRRTPLQIAAARHAARTQEQIDTIKKRAEERQVMLRYADGTPFSAAQLASFAELEKKLGIKRGRPMTIEQADEQSANPNWSKHGFYQVNCATCAPAFMMRLAGFDIVARPKTRGSMPEKLSHEVTLGNKWRYPNGDIGNTSFFNEWMAAKGYKKLNKVRYKEFYNEMCTDVGFYETFIAWKGRGAHATILYRSPDGGLYNIEPQIYNGTPLRPIDEICEAGRTDGRWSPDFGVLRVDDKVFNMDYASAFSASKESELKPMVERIFKF